MKKRNLFTPGILIVSFFCILYSCKSREDAVIAGKGGRASLYITPRHHSVNIVSGIVYIKYNTSDLPSVGFDDSAACLMINGVPVATFTNLHKGNYYLYAKGIDTGKLEVHGGKPYTITEEKAINTNIPVSEEL